MAMNIGSIFLGGITAKPRKFLTALFEHLRSKGYEKIHIPCTGQFTIVKCAIEAGFAKENIYTSDVSLFSSVLGYMFNGKGLSELKFNIIDPRLKELYGEQTTDEGRAAALFLFMKMAQLRTNVYYEKCFLEEMEGDLKAYHAKILPQVQEAVRVYKGINYEIKDVRDYFDEVNQAAKVDEIVVMNPPAFKNGYEKMFAFDKYISYVMPVPEFDFGKEWMECYIVSENMPAPYIWYTSKDVVKELPKQHIIFANEDGANKYTYFLTPAFDTIMDMDGAYSINRKFTNNQDISHYRLFTELDTITPDTKIHIELINADTALYYRDLFAHRLGATVSESYMAIFADGKFMAVAAFNATFLRKLEHTFIFESFCFNVPSKVYENLNRLCMLLLLSGEFKKFLYAKLLNALPHVEMKSMRTVCLSKYRKVKLNNGIMQLLDTEKLPNGTYKLLYEQPFYEDRNYKDCLAIYLEKDVKYKAAKVLSGLTEETN